MSQSVCLTLSLSLSFSSFCLYNIFFINPIAIIQVLDDEVLGLDEDMIEVDIDESEEVFEDIDWTTCPK